MNWPDMNPEGGLGLWQRDNRVHWYRDPWGWPEFNWLRKRPASLRFSDYYNARTNDLTASASFSRLDVPKSPGALRPAVVQDPLSTFLYFTAVAAAMPQLHSQLPSFVFGRRDRDVGNESAQGETSRDDEWPRYVQHLRAGRASPAGLRADITSFLASIDVTDLLVRIRRRIGNGPACGVIERVLSDHNAVPGRSGLPQSSFGSAVLANFYAADIDKALLTAQKRGRVTLVARWLDDITAFGTTAELNALYEVLDETVRRMGMKLNASKSHIGTADEVINSIVLEQLYEVKAKSRIIEDKHTGPVEVLDRSDLSLLMKLEDFVIELGSEAPRDWLRSTLQLLIANRAFGREGEWRRNACDIPHAADMLGRYLRAAAESSVDEPRPQASHGNRGRLRWEELNSWLDDTLRSRADAPDWVKANLVLAVPAPVMSPALLDTMRQWLEESDDVQLVGVAGQRLARRDHTACLDISRRRVDHVRDPLVQRALALALVQTGDAAALAREVIRGSDSNVLLELALSENGWQPPKVPRDFDR